MMDKVYFGEKILTREEILKEERERIKAIIKRKIEAVEIGLSKKKTKRGQLSIGKSHAIRILETIIFLMDNPDYVRMKDRTGLEKTEEIDTEKLKKGWNNGQGFD